MRATADPKLDLLGHLPLFAGLPKRDLERIANVAEVVDVPPGRDLTVEGRLGHEFFVLVDGGACVHRGGEVLGSVEPGAFFGELAVLSCGTRTATVTTTAPSRVVVIHAPDFRQVVQETAAVAGRLLPVVARRLAA